MYRIDPQFRGRTEAQVAKIIQLRHEETPTEQMPLFDNDLEDIEFEPIYD